MSTKLQLDFDLTVSEAIDMLSLLGCVLYQVRNTKRKRVELSREFLESIPCGTAAKNISDNLMGIDLCSALPGKDFHGRLIESIEEHETKFIFNCTDAVEEWCNGGKTMREVIQSITPYMQELIKKEEKKDD